jgi:hypothetical protein
MRAANATTIVSIIEHLNLPFTPVKDNITELQNPELARKSGNVDRVPILAGTTAQEGRVFGEKQTLFLPFFSPASNDFRCTADPSSSPSSHVFLFNQNTAKATRPQR